VLALNVALLFKGAEQILVYPLTLILVVGMAGFSYTYFEAWFLQFKQKFSTITSGESTA
jgi:peptidoglycan/LPS O-acetylase OafA/YrhL